VQNCRQQEVYYIEETGKETMNIKRFINKKQATNFIWNEILEENIAPVEIKVSQTTEFYQEIFVPLLFLKLYEESKYSHMPHDQVK